MGSRYMVSGVQLGMLKALSQNGDEVAVENLLNEIAEEQHIEDSDDSLEEDIKLTRDLYRGK